MPRFINELNYDKKPYDSFDKNPAKIGFVNDLAEELAVGASFYSDQDQSKASAASAPYPAVSSVTLEIDKVRQG